MRISWNIYDLAVDGLQLVGCAHFILLHMLWISSARFGKLSPFIYLILLDTLLLIYESIDEINLFFAMTLTPTPSRELTHPTWPGKKRKVIFTFGTPNGRGHRTVFYRGFLDTKTRKQQTWDHLSNEKKTLGLFRVHKGWNTNQLNRDYIIKPSWNKDPVIKQAAFHGKYSGKYPAVFFVHGSSG